MFKFIINHPVISSKTRKVDPIMSKRKGKRKRLITSPNSNIYNGDHDKINNIRLLLANFNLK